MAKQLLTLTVTIAGSLATSAAASPASVGFLCSAFKMWC